MYRRSIRRERAVEQFVETRRCDAIRFQNIGHVQRETFDQAAYICFFVIRGECQTYPGATRRNPRIRRNANEDAVSPQTFRDRERRA